jgi:hypothetical protein
VDGRRQTGLAVNRSGEVCVVGKPELGAKRRLPRLRRFAFKILVFACGAALLYSVGEHGLAIAFGTLAAVNLGLAVAWNQA